MASISLKKVKKIYPNGYEAIKDFNLEIEDKEFIILVGPSGCGKSTTLRMIAGLEPITAGEVVIDEKKVNDEEPKDRDIAMVFQNYALYPHMTVYDNMAFSLKMRKIPKMEIDKAVRSAAKILDLEELLGRRPKALSGGQRQRVAMGRAIVRDPKVFLMDEPLSNLDAKLRVQMRLEIAKLHNRLGATIIYVTHDQTEAMTLGTRIVVMRDGDIMQVDTPKKVYDRPRNLFVAGFIGSPQMNFLRGKIREQQSSIIFESGDRKFEIPSVNAEVLKKEGYTGKEVIMGIRSEDIRVAQWNTYDDGHVLPAEVKAYELLGAEACLYTEFKGGNLVCRVRPDTPAKRGDVITLTFDMNKAHFFDVNTEQNIMAPDA
ncbi:sn-glycerol-3-phosphate ABC transporter ATP-binding protein UgpC [Lawsonibacter sp. OA9]|uniref:ABC transporter ATP-binding protein n=1 Tax=Oscillospiraceae TaxID=216572 RepID=UPI001F05C71F|nr:MULTISPECIES: sn-glycerol-3-phosphate ABC transporter ATP-binding protein UgpC [Oscillospiraceae]MCH1978307.1 sn-glycerol-3-phosphate ABC transporter ATP-binding protein UgpC [Lawsonibacter sp. OA9]MCH1983800.1 sn-glycerol-3-phosphate ABC transporter ATP-binding protein UgpC [Ruminococcus sp. OA3]